LEAARSARRSGSPVDRRLPAAEQVYRALREAIVTCALEPNEAISESRLCGMFHVSRSPVRIAVTRLAEDGLIDIFPQRGTFVAPIKLRRMREAQLARTALEVALVAEAARRWQDRHTAELRANLARQERHAQSGDSWRFYLDNEAFHQVIARAAELDGFWTMFHGLKMLWDRIGHLANRMPAHMADIIEQHRRIARALERRDVRAARAAMRLHLRSLDHAIARLRPLHSGYFVEG
jgi:DNA-binding GntR family transcriptional regulator